MTERPTTAVDQDVNKAQPDPHDLAMIDAYLEHLRRAGRSAETIRLRRSTLTQLNAALTFGLGGAADNELAEWIYDERIQSNSRATYLSGVRGFYRWAVRAKWITLDPTVELESIRTTRGIARPCTDEQLHAILTTTPKRIQVWAAIAAYEGLRCCEISGLDREHITEQRLIVVRGKGGAARVHDTDPCVWEKVRDLPPGPIATLVTTGERASADYVSKMGKAWFRRRGVDITMHQLRHWLGCTVQEKYKDARVTMELLGHASLNATSIYTRATLTQQRSARAMLPRLAG
jgi:integrase/recombinase XerC